jgi:hypothetical protein
MNIENSDIIFGKQGNLILTASRQAWYLDRLHKRNVKAAVKMLKIALPYFTKYVNIDKNVVVRLAGIKKRTTHGHYQSEWKLATVDYRHKLTDMMQTLAHELVHAEQYHEGRLAHGKTYPFTQVWQGESYISKGKNKYSRYLNQPWEIEARDRQIDIAHQVWMDMYNDGHVSLNRIKENVGILWLKKHYPEIYEQFKKD